MNWEKFMLQIGLVLLLKWLGDGDKDSSEFETKIFETDDKDKMVELVVGKVVADAIKAKGVDPESEAVINELVAVRNKEMLVKVINKPETKMSIADVIFNFLRSIFGR